MQRRKPQPSIHIFFSPIDRKMASTLGSVTAISSLSSIALISIKRPSLFTEPHHQPLHSFPSNRLSIIRTSSFLSGVPLSSTKWSMPAAAAEDGPVVDDSIASALEPVPEPVEAQIEAAAGTSTCKAEVFAVVMVGSRQYIVIPGRFIYTQRLKGANVNDKVILSKVLLVGTKTKAYIGQPVVTNAAVHAIVEEQGLDKKVVVFKYKKKKNYRRNIGHRQPNTRIRITGITGYEDFPADTMPEAVPA